MNGKCQEGRTFSFSDADVSACDPATETVPIYSYGQCNFRDVFVGLLQQETSVIQSRKTSIFMPITTRFQLIDLLFDWLEK